MPDKLKIPNKEDQALIRDHYHSGHKGYYPNNRDGGPFPPPPSMFQVDPLVIGPPDVARLAKLLIDLDPDIKANLKNITVGPTAASMRQMDRSRLPIDRFNMTTLMGIYGDGKIGIQPGMHPNDTLDTLIHEIAHAGGHGERGAKEAENIPRLKRPR